MDRPPQSREGTGFEYGYNAAEVMRDLASREGYRQLFDGHMVRRLVSWQQGETALRLDAAEATVALGQLAEITLGQQPQAQLMGLHLVLEQWPQPATLQLSGQLTINGHRLRLQPPLVGREAEQGGVVVSGVGHQQLPPLTKQQVTDLLAACRRALLNAEPSAGPDQSPDDMAELLTQLGQLSGEVADTRWATFGDATTDKVVSTARLTEIRNRDELIINHQVQMYRPRAQVNHAAQQLGLDITQSQVYQPGLEPIDDQSAYSQASLPPDVMTAQEFLVRALARDVNEETMPGALFIEASQSATEADIYRAICQQYLDFLRDVVTTTK